MKMKEGESIDIWIVYSKCATGQYIEGVYTNETQANKEMEKFKSWDRSNSIHWVRPISTKPHKELPHA